MLSHTQDMWASADEDMSLGVCSVTPRISGPLLMKLCESRYAQISSPFENY